jgi:hypothetical protein
MRQFSLLIAFFYMTLASGQSSDSSFNKFKIAENELKSLQNQAFLSRNEKERIEGNKAFIAIWDRIVSDPNILNYAFDSLREISVLKPKDKKFMLITWNLQRDDGTHNFFGYLLVNNSRREKTGPLSHRTIAGYEHFKLLDRSVTVKSPENYIGTPEKWFGMLYTQVIECDGYYTLLAWDGNDKLTQRKFIDVLYFKSNGDPVFGKDVFRFPRKNPRRMMFEWSQEVSMSLRYNESRDMILFHHLVPRERNPAIENQFQFYGPDAQFDALVMKNHKWILVENVEANSDIDPVKNSRKPNPRKQKPVYTPH